MRFFLINLLFCCCLFVKAQTNDKANFSESELSISLKDITLYGTLTTPDGYKKKWPLVLIIAGSGPTNRDGNNIAAGLNANSYKQLADSLATHNIASFRYDKRSVGKSIPFETSKEPRLFDIEVNDAKEIIVFLKKQGYKKITIAGHSQGALVGMLASKKAAKFISLCGVGINGAETIRFQLSTQPKFVGEKAGPILDSLIKGHLVNDIPQYLAPLFNKNLQPYLQSWFKYTPAIELTKLKMPALIIQGDNDIQIRVEDAKEYISLTPNAKLAIIEGMNHVFKIVSPKREDNFKSYGNPALPIPHQFVKTIVDFIKQ
jgi:uncharacterized protein